MFSEQVQFNLCTFRFSFLEMPIEYWVVFTEMIKKVAFFPKYCCLSLKLLNVRFSFDFHQVQMVNSALGIIKTGEC